LRVNWQSAQAVSPGFSKSPQTGKGPSLWEPQEKPSSNRPSSQKFEWQKLMEIARLRRIDQMVRAHERAHLVAGGELVRGGPHYIYKIGPDGKRYAVGGDVEIDTSPVPGDPKATLQKAEKIVRAALAPLNPSPQDLRVAMQAQIMAMKAQMEIIKTQSSGG